jgi:Ca2+/Na+ antiporter
MLAEIGWLALGLLLLALGADSTLKGAAGFALQIGMRPLRVGVAALLLGAALPELAFGIRAAEAGAPELAFAMLLGRCVVNLALVLGLLHLLVEMPQPGRATRLASGSVALVLSLPLLGSAWFAGFRGLGAIALGLVLGSSLFNLLFLAGLLAATEVLPVPEGALGLELPALLATSGLALALLSTERLPARAKGAVLLLAYLGVLGTLVWRASA